MATTQEMLARLVSQQSQRQLSNEEEAAFSAIGQARQESQQSEGIGGDIARYTKAGFAELPSQITGIADAAAANVGAARPFDKLTDQVGERIGFQPEQYAQELRSQISPEGQQATQDAQRAIQEDPTITGTLKAYAQNPRALLQPVFSNVAQIAAIAAGTAASSAAPFIGGLGVLSRSALIEGLLSGGGSFSNFDEAAVDADPTRFGRAAAGSAATTAGFARLGAGLAKRLGVGDPDIVFTQGRAQLAPGQLPRSFARRVIGGAISEGVFEELPQSASEQVWNNWANGDELFKGVTPAAVEGALIGGIFGGAVNIVAGKDPQVATDLTGDTGEAASTPNKKAFNVVDLDQETLLDARSALTMIAENASDQPDVAAKALSRRKQIDEEMARRGLDQGLVNEVEAENRYAFLYEQTRMMRNKYREQVAGREKGDAAATSAKIKKNLDTMKQLEDAYPQSPGKAMANQYNRLIETNLDLTEKLAKAKTPEERAQLRAALTANRQARAAHKRVDPNSKYTGKDKRFGNPTKGKPKPAAAAPKAESTAATEAPTAQQTTETAAQATAQPAAAEQTPAVEVPWYVQAIIDNDAITEEQRKALIGANQEKLLTGKRSKKGENRVEWFERVAELPIKDVLDEMERVDGPGGSPTKAILVQTILDRRADEVAEYEAWQAENNARPINAEELGFLISDAKLSGIQREIMDDFLSADELRGQAIADIAKTRGVDRKTVAESVAAIKPKIIKALVARRGITNEQALAKWQEFSDSYLGRDRAFDESEADITVERLDQEIAAAREQGDDALVAELQAERDFAESKQLESEQNAAAATETIEGELTQAVNMLDTAASEEAEGASQGTGTQKGVSGYQSQESAVAQDVDIQIELLGIEPELYETLGQLREEGQQIKGVLKQYEKELLTLQNLKNNHPAQQKAGEVKQAEAWWGIITQLSNTTQKLGKLEAPTVTWRNVYNDPVALRTWLNEVNESMKEIVGGPVTRLEDISNNDRVRLMRRMLTGMNMIGRQFTDNGQITDPKEFHDVEYHIADLAGRIKEGQELLADTEESYNVQSAPLTAAITRYAEENAGDPAALARVFGFTESQIKKSIKGPTTGRVTQEHYDLAKESTDEINESKQKAEKRKLREQARAANMTAEEFLGAEASEFQLDEAGEEYNSDEILFYDTEESSDFYHSVSLKDAEAPTTAQRVRDVLGRAFLSDREALNDRITVVDKPQDLALLADVLNIEIDSQTQGFAAQNRIYLIAQNIPAGQELAVALHEIGVHLGMRNLLGRQYFKQLSDQLFAWANSSESGVEVELAKLALNRVVQAENHLFGTGKLYDPGDRAQEMIAYFVEEAVAAGFDPTGVVTKKVGGSKVTAVLRKIYAAFKSALRKLRLDPRRLTAQNIVDLAYGGARFELGGSHHGTAANFRKFSHDYLFTGEGANAYGLGTYSAQRYGIARDYWNSEVRRKNRQPRSAKGWEDPEFIKELQAASPLIVPTTYPIDLFQLKANLTKAIEDPNNTVAAEEAVDTLFAIDRVNSLLRRGARLAQSDFDGLVETMSIGGLPPRSNHPVMRALRTAIEMNNEMLEMQRGDLQDRYDSMQVVLGDKFDDFIDLYDSGVADPVEAFMRENEPNLTQAQTDRWWAVLENWEESFTAVERTEQGTAMAQKWIQILGNGYGTPNSVQIRHVTQLAAIFNKAERGNAALDAASMIYSKNVMKGFKDAYFTEPESATPVDRGQIKLLDSSLTAENSIMWDKDWDGQSNDVQNGILKTWKMLTDQPAEMIRILNSGASIYNNIVEEAIRLNGGVSTRRNRAIAEKEVTQLLAVNGVAGIRFYDGNSRHLKKRQGVDPDQFTRLNQEYLSQLAQLEKVEAELESKLGSASESEMTEVVQRAQNIKDRMRSTQTNMEYLLNQRRTINYVNFTDRDALPLSAHKDADSSRVMFSRRADARLENTAVQQMPSELRYRYNTTKKYTRRLTDMFKFSTDFAKSAAAQGMPAIKDYYDAAFDLLADRNDLEVSIQEVVDPAKLWKASKRQKFNKFMARSTVEEKWGFDAYAEGIEQSPIKVDLSLNKEFRTMDKEMQQTAIRMFKQAKYLRDEFNRQAAADIVESYNEMIDRASANPERVAELKAQRDGAEAAILQRVGQGKPAYLPLKRFGRYAVVLKSSDFVAAQAAGNDELVGEMKTQPEHYRVSFFESDVDAQRTRDEWSRRVPGASVEKFERLRLQQSTEMVPRSMINALRTKLEAMEFADEDGTRNVSASAAAQAVEKLYIQMLNEDSIRKSELERIGVTGFDEDMIRSYVTHATSMAGGISALKLGRKTQRALQAVKDQAREPGDRDRKVEMANELFERHAINMNPDNHPITDKILGTTSIWMLLSSPAYYIQNATQPFMISLPVIGGQFGMAATSAKLVASYTDAQKMWAKKLDGQLAVITPETVPDVNLRDLFLRMQREQILDVGITADLGAFKNPRGILGAVVGRVHQKMIQGVRTVELFNRVATAKTAYDLHFAKYKDVQAAQNYAVQVVRDTQGDYSGLNAPRAFNQWQLARVATQFRKFQILQIGVLARALGGVFSGATAEEKFIAGKQLTYILSTHAAMGGLLGLPAANLIGMALAAMNGGDGEPEDAELMARKAIGNKEVADLILKGLPAYLGLDTSSRLGMGQTLAIMPFTDIKYTREGAAVALAGLLGPSAAQLGQTMDGIGMIMEGNTFLGVAQMLPRGIRDAMKAYQYSTVGVTRRNATQDVAMSPEEMDMIDIAFQGLGWPTTTLSDRMNANRWLRITEESFQSRADELKLMYVRGDKQRARKEWRELQQMRRYYGFNVQSVTLLTSAPADKRERESNMIEGVFTENTNKRFVRSLFE